MTEVKKKIPLVKVPTCSHCKKDLKMDRDGWPAYQMSLCGRCYVEHRINPIFGVLK